MMHLEITVLCFLSVVLLSRSENFGENRLSDEGAHVPRAYEWHYSMGPRRFHSEKKDVHGNVGGEIAYVDAHGNDVNWNYKATPEEGFKVTVYKTGPGSDGNTFRSPIFPHFDPVESPRLRSALENKKIIPAGLDGNQARFAVDPQTVFASRSLSELARDLDAIPVAAVHDGRAPPHKMKLKDQTSPVLLHHEPVPTQEGRNFFILVPFE